MAIGLGRILGYQLRENFNQPYLATSFTDFWRRWHISLSTWIKEYLYIPLGGNRVPVWRSYCNLCICFVLSGLWHGASWNFVIWGCAHGIALVLDRAFWLKAQKTLPTAVNRLLTFPLILLTWVFFRCATFPTAMDYFRALFGGATAAIADGPVPAFDLVAMLAIGFGIILAPLASGRLDQPPRPASAGRRVAILAACCVLLFLSVGRMAVSSFHPFLYFRF
jgi:alginate O-acetyltransferase complex protein AlgI